MKYISHSISYARPIKYHLAIGVPFFKEFRKKVNIIFINDQYNFMQAVSFDRAKYRIILNLDGNKPVLDIKKTGDYIPELFET